jgi:hypothetical protein
VLTNNKYDHKKKKPPPVYWRRLSGDPVGTKLELYIRRFKVNE